ncbi:EAL domain-containing protein [Rheinheimera sp. YQF-2]|uniref:EAL domain-containing protein n=1 Tax=Rheinheimera lutimaris TaxID=2740584 RepID=A0A7Y5EHQ1_9GAMM|nr:EAL domain-containing protein [Rheinheimera lutimaris]NRQ42720.1 EAL domain-containing protein [Rheinheimera lutimaris]
MEKSVLVVDDETGILKAISRVLSRSGYSVKTASCGDDALTILQSWPCKVVLTDFRMPTMDGAELLATIQTHFPDIVGLVISGYSDFESVKKLLNAGTAFRFLQKPWEDEELLLQVGAALEHYQQHRFNRQAGKMLLAASEPLLELSSEGIVLQVNAAARALLGDEVSKAGCLLASLVRAEDKDKISATLFDATRSVFVTLDSLVEIELSCRLVGPGSCIIELSYVTVPVLVNNVFDLPAMLNYQQLLQLIPKYIQNARSLALVAVKIRSFELWSRVIGYTEAERALESIAEQLLASSSALGELAFLANEQFVIVIPVPDSEMQVLQNITEILSSITGHQQLAKGAIDFAVSYCLLPEDGNDPRTILNNLLLGNMLVAQSTLRMFMRYDRQAVERKKHQLSLSQALHSAIEQDQLFLHFQAKFDLHKQALSGCEVLVRWHHPEFGIVSPSLFIPLAEQQGQIIEIGYWVLKQAFQALVNWNKKGIHIGKMAVNISGRQLMEPDFIEWVKHHLTQHGVNAAQLEFELTETFLLENFDDCVNKLKVLSELGISIAIDDFGTGYSSLAYLNKLPLNVLKIDRSLIADVESNLQTQSLVANIVRLAHDLNLRVVVEGVETMDQLQLVQQMGCDVIQGYFIARPQSEQGYIALLSSAQSQSAVSLYGGADV